MRLLVELLIIGGLISLAWEQPLKARLEQLEATVRAAAAAIGSKLKSTAVPQETPAAMPAGPIATATPVPQPKVIFVTPTAPPRGAWMWDEKRHSPLDRPAYDQTQPVQRYHDQYGRSYWLDANGMRHYDQ
jgi:hypothetical protein